MSVLASVIVGGRRPAAAAAALPAMTLAPVALAEGDGGTTAFVFALTLDRKGRTDPVGYAWSVAGLGPDAADAADFGGAFPSGSGTFAQGETVKPISVPVAGDRAVELAERFTVTVSATIATALAPATATGTILNDDSAEGALLFDRASQSALTLLLTEDI